MRLKFLSVLILILTAFSFKLIAEKYDYFQEYMEDRASKVINDPMGVNDPIFIRGSSIDQENDIIDYMLKCIECESLSDFNVLDLVDYILSKNSDVICVQDILSDNDAHALYLGLNKKYDYFLYIPPKGPNSGVEGSDCGMLFISKYWIKEQHFKIFNNEDTNEGYFDFIIENRGIELGHIYAANIAKNNSEEKVTSKIMQIFNKIQYDVEQNNKAMPFLLFGCLNNLQITKDLKDQLMECFDSNNDGPNGILVVKYLNISIHLDTVEPEEIESNDNIKTEDCSLDDSVIEKKMVQLNLNYKRSLFTRETDKTIVNNLEGYSFRSSKNYSYLKKVIVRGGGGFKYYYGGKDNNKFEANANLEYQDKNGNYIGANVGRNNEGQKSAEIYAGYESSSNPKGNQSSDKSKRK